MNTKSMDIDRSIPAVVLLEPARKKTLGAKAVAQSVASKCAILLINACTGILTARTLGAAGRGELAAMILWPFLLPFATTLGIPTALIYHMRHRSRDRGELVSNGFAMSIALGLVATAFGALILPKWLHQYSPTAIHAAQV